VCFKVKEANGELKNKEENEGLTLEMSGFHAFEGRN